MTVYPEYRTALAQAQSDLAMFAELEIRSALKQCANDEGIPYGDEMGAFVRWAEKEMGLA
jgi:hypothetical protein